MRTVVTGAASGIGQAIALRLAKEPEPALLLVDRDADRLAAVVAEVQSIGAVVSGLVVDVADTAVGEIVGKAVGDRLGGLDSLVSNAGFARYGVLENLDAKEFDEMLSINTRATLLLANALLPLLKESRGAIVATASISSLQPTPSVGIYATSKAALVMLVRQMALDWGPDGVRCNCVSPGSIHTPASAASYDDPVRRQQREQEIPLRRLGKADDIANAVAFLLSEQASYITGTNLLVDGGLGQTLLVSAMSATQG